MSDLSHIRLLFVEDDPTLRQEMTALLELFGCDVRVAHDGQHALQRLESEDVDIVLTDIRMPRLDGLGLARQLKKILPDLPVILYSAFTDTPMLLEGIELGVAGFIEKPTDADKLLQTLERAALPVLQQRQVEALHNELEQSVIHLIGLSDALRPIAEQVVRVAHTDYPLLLQGETGSGKTRLAHRIHALSQRASQPLVTLQLGTLSEGLIAAELFGHEKGAFTGAEKHRKGLVEEADGGTLFLDDIDSAPSAVQAALLQLVEEKTFVPVGGNQPRQVDLRIFAASNRNLQHLSTSGGFRSDLYHRLAGVVLTLPPLRDMTEDIPEFATQFLAEFSDDLGITPPQLSADALDALQHHHWPGNIRELRNVLRRVAVQTNDGLVTRDTLRLVLQSPPSPPPPNTPPDNLPMTMAAIEKWALEQALESCGGRPTAAARQLGLNYYTFKRRLLRHHDPAPKG
ncbi:MAG: hypothetical protein C0621_02995 [Desulfuromonas sp.]|nr:MAG: hypothetical protein C0621_02995 [Desulfuromonas sp.]